MMHHGAHGDVVAAVLCMVTGAQHRGQSDGGHKSTTEERSATFSTLKYWQFCSNACVVERCAALLACHECLVSLSMVGSCSAML